MNRSKQKEAILDVLRNTKSHPTAEWIYTKAREEIPNLSLGTVYRNLSLFVSEGMISKISVGDGNDHFDFNTKPHTHFVCEGCGSILDIDLAFDENKIREYIVSDFSGIVRDQRLLFYGLCEDCKDRELNE